MALWLNRLGAQVVGIGLPPVTQPNLFDLLSISSMVDTQFCDIRDPVLLAAQVRQARPEVVFHLAAQALVRSSYYEPLATFSTNVQGTANVLDALRPLESTRVVVAVTTDKVYRNLEQPLPYRETDALGGRDPYSASKAAAEIVIASYRDSYLDAKGIAVASARAGNVIGGGDWSQDRLIPDAIRDWNAKQPLYIRRPQAVRPWQHVLEPLAGYMTLAEKLWKDPTLSGAYNFGPETHHAATVRQVVQLAQGAYGMGRVSWGDGAEGPHEAGWLTLEVAKARGLLGVKPQWPLEESVLRTLRWYRQYYDGADAGVLCDSDIEAYESVDEQVVGS